MKKNIHPKMREILFKDVTTGDTFTIKSTLNPNETAQGLDGKAYPTLSVETSSKSHPAYLGGHKLDTPLSSRAERFKQRYAK